MCVRVYILTVCMPRKFKGPWYVHVVHNMHQGTAARPSASMMYTAAPTIVRPVMGSALRSTPQSMGAENASAGHINPYSSRSPFARLVLELKK
jgi:hypothetical protein